VIIEAGRLECKGNLLKQRGVRVQTSSVISMSHAFLWATGLAQGCVVNSLMGTSPGLSPKGLLVATGSFGSTYLMGAFCLLGLLETHFSSHRPQEVHSLPQEKLHIRHVGSMPREGMEQNIWKIREGIILSCSPPSFWVCKAVPAPLNASFPSLLSCVFPFVLSLDDLVSSTLPILPQVWVRYLPYSHKHSKNLAQDILIANQLGK
jgi:hypothetical protein